MSVRLATLLADPAGVASPFTSSAVAPPVAPAALAAAASRLSGAGA
jgi:hypothetical protein